MQMSKFFPCLGLHSPRADLREAGMACSSMHLPKSSSAVANMSWAAQGPPSARREDTLLVDVTVLAPSTGWLAAIACWDLSACPPAGNSVRCSGWAALMLELCGCAWRGRNCAMSRGCNLLI